MKFIKYIRVCIISNVVSNLWKGGLLGIEIVEIVSWDVVCVWVKSKLKGEIFGLCVVM